MAISYIKDMQNNSIRTVSRSILKKADRNIPVPFELSLYEHKSPLYCDKVIRIIPGKRIVCFGKWDNKPVVAKLFFEWSKSKKHLHRDVNGIETLVAANIPTPKLLYQGTDTSKRIHILIFDRILESCNLDLLWNEKSDFDELNTLMQAVTVELATQHVLGVIQEDLHLKNFLVTSKTIYTLDGGSITQSEGILSKKESLDHLGLFFAQLGAGTETLQKELFDLYAQSRGWIVRPADIELLEQSTKKWNALRKTRYQKKIMRDCTAFRRIEKINSLIMYDREYTSAEFKKLLENPESFFALSDSQILKSGGSSTVVKVKVDGKWLVVKRYNIKGFWHGLRRCLRPTRAVTSWRLAHHLRLMGIPTPKPLAFIEKRFLGLRQRSYFIMEYVEGPHAGEYFSRYRSDENEFTQVAKRIVVLLNQLAELQITHGDLKMTNILINHERPLIIDLDGMQEHQHSLSFKRTFKKEMGRFMRNWESFPSVRELFEKLL